MHMYVCLPCMLGHGTFVLSICQPIITSDMCSYRIIDCLAEKGKQWYDKFLETVSNSACKTAVCVCVCV